MSLFKVEWERPAGDIEPGGSQYRGIVVTLYDAEMPGFYRALMLAESLSEGGWFNVQWAGEAHGPGEGDYTWLVAGHL